MYVKKGRKVVPLLGVLASLLERGVDMRLIHAKEFCPAFREDFDKYPITGSLPTSGPPISRERRWA